MATKIDLQTPITFYEEVINYCNTHIELCGFCLCKCNSIVINKERMMTVTTDENHMTTYEFSPLHPTYFSPKVAKKIVDEDIYSDIHGNRIKLEIIGELEYYKLLKMHAEFNLNVLKGI